MTQKNLLLPSGLYDLLPPDARKEADAVARLLAAFESFGYAQVTPPLMEFETSLLAGRWESLAAQTFRVMDPISQNMMGFRSDMTLQVARIARSRLKAEPRPLRLCYAGPVLQTRPEPLRNERQLTQAGIELIGADAPQADAEVMIVAVEALSQLGITDISIDLNLPGLLGELCPEAQENKDLRTQIKDAILRKDAAAIIALPFKRNKDVARLMDAAGPLQKALAVLRALALPQADMIDIVAERVKRNCPHATLTLDPIEYRGFDYHQGIGFSIFARGLRHELGRGGRYQAESDGATGFTLYVTHLLRLLDAPAEKKRALVSPDIPPEKARALRSEGWVTVYGVTKDLVAEAKKMAIKHVWNKGSIKEET